MAEAEIEEKGGKMTMVLLGVVIVLLVIICGVGGYFLGMKHGGATTAAPVAAPSAAAAAPAAEATGVDDAESKAIGSLLPFDDIIVNLLDDQETRYLKAAITLELDSLAAADEVTARKPQVRDAIILLMSNKTLKELHDLQGKLQLRAELVERINSFLQAGKVKNIYFTDFIVQ